jgi:hypothetical protein
MIPIGQKPIQKGLIENLVEKNPVLLEDEQVKVELGTIYLPHEVTIMSWYAKHFKKINLSFFIRKSR